MVWGVFCVMCALLWGATRIAMVAPLSFTNEGKWAASINPDLECATQHLCSPGNKTWHPSKDASRAPYRLFNTETACAALLARNISQIHFHGDSFMRQIYAAMLITLNGNYRNGSIGTSAHAQASGAAACTFNKQFEEKKCGVRQLNHYGVVCGGRIVLDPLLNGLHDLNGCSRNPGTIALLSFGNYKIGPYGGRVGVNNATSYMDFYKSGLCPQIKARFPAYPAVYDAKQAAVCRVVWVSTHARLHAYFADEAPEIVRTYNTEMRHFYDSGQCGPVGYIDVFNMTTGLVETLPDESRAMSYDQVHWGMEVNLVKAQLILNALVQ